MDLCTGTSSASEGSVSNSPNPRAGQPKSRKNKKKKRWQSVERQAEMRQLFINLHTRMGWGMGGGGRLIVILS